MRTLNFFLLLIFYPGLIISQVTPFQRSYGGINNDLGNSIVSLGNRGQIILGTTSNFNSKNTDLITIRINSEGKTEVANRYGGAQNETAEHIELTSDGGYILLASSTSFGAGNSDILVIKTNANGSVEWSRAFGGSGDDYAACIKQGPDGGYIIAGRTQSFGTGGDDAYLIKINNQGDQQWSKAYGTNNNERFYYIDNAPNEEFIVTGIENNSNSLNYDALVMRIDKNGNILSNTSFGDNGGLANDASDCIRATLDGGYAFSGHYKSYGAGSLDLALTKVDARGNIEWARVFGNTGDERAWDFQIDESNNYLLSGYTSSYGNGRNEALAILVNNNGIPKWSRSYGGRSNEEFYECTINNDSIIFIGYTESFGAGGSDLYIVKTDFSGTSANGCLATTTSIRNSSIIPKTRIVAQMTTNLNSQTISTIISLTNVSIDLNSITNSNPCLQPTPVKLIGFSHYKKDDNSILYWQTSSEINTKIFIIEESIDGIKFDSIGFSNASNRGENYQEYRYLLSSRNNPSAYYRLKIIDYDGFKGYSNIIYSYNENKFLYVYPTCFKNSIQVQTNIADSYLLNIDIVSINGIGYHKKTHLSEENIQINTEQWPSGIYIIRITNTENNECSIKKIMKE